MAYEIIGETIKSATSIKIGEIFKVASTNQNNQITYTYPNRYKENITVQRYPNFHIIQVNLDITPAGRNRMQLDYLMNVQYRVAENTETITNLQQQLDAVGLKLSAELTELNLELPTKTKNRNYTKSDGVLQFFFNITVFATPETEEDPKFKNYNLETEVIE